MTLESYGVDVVVMEADGVYRNPVWHVLESHFKLVLASLVPPAALQELRTLTRTRERSVRERASPVQRIEKGLEDANPKLSVAHNRFMLELRLEPIGPLHRATAAIEKDVGSGIEPLRRATKLLGTMPGPSSVSASVVALEIGIVGRFATAGHLLSGACLCSHNDESAGKRRSTRWRRGAKKAIVAVVASMPTAARHLLRDGTAWRNLGAAHFDRSDATQTANRLIRRLQQIGCIVDAEPA